MDAVKLVIDQEMKVADAAMDLGGGYIIHRLRLGLSTTKVAQ